MSRVWRKAKADWGAWNACSLAEEPIVRLILGRHRGAGPARPQGHLKSLLLVIGVRGDGQKVLLALKKHGWRDHRALARCSRRSGRSRPTVRNVHEKHICQCRRDSARMIQEQLGSYVGEDDILRLVELV